MLDVPYLLAAVGLAAGITFALRALPFAVIEPLRSSRLAGELAARMPVGLTLILVIYLLRDVPTSTTPTASVTVVAALVVVGLHWWRSNALLCIFAGTAARLRIHAPACQSVTVSIRSPRLRSPLDTVHPRREYP
jgi:branched chain amino acid efflux pump